MRRACVWLLALVGCTPAHVTQAPPPQELLHAAKADRASEVLADALAYPHSIGATPEGITALGPLIAQVKVAQEAGDRRATDRAVRALRDELNVLGAAQR